ncbi:MAG TPA: protein kinase [Firmicutes bacterium]|nr:protein kinase [Bacillota bacterium]
MRTGPGFGQDSGKTVLSEGKTPRGIEYLIVEDQSGGQRYRLEEFGFEREPKKRVLIELVRNLEKRQSEIEGLAPRGFIRPLGVENIGDKYYVKTDFYEGEALGDYLKHAEPSPEKAVKWMISIARVMDEFSRQGKPLHGPTLESVIISNTGEAALLDPYSLGILAPYRSGTGNIQDNFNPPEVIKGKPWTPAQDLFAAGVTFYFMLTGKLPFDDPEPKMITENILERKPADPRYHNPDISGEIAELVMALLEKSPEARPKSPGDLLERLHKIEQAGAFHARPEEQVDIKKKAESFARAQKLDRVKRSLRMRAGLIAGIIAAILVVVYLFQGGKNPPVITAKTPPDKVVALYYQAIDNLDPQLLDEAIDSKAGRNVIRWVTNLYVINKVNMGMMLQAGRVGQAGPAGPAATGATGTGESQVSSSGPPTEAKGGKEPQVQQVLDPVKLTGLRINKISEAAGEIKFEATYSLTLPSGEGEVTRRHRDLLTLRKVRDKWKIVELKEEIEGQ